MYKVFVKGLVQHLGVTSPAQLKTGLLCLEGSGRIGGLVALAAHFVLHGWVHILKKHSRLI